jgi:hypothetical protein
MGAKNKVIAGDYKGWLVLSSLLGRYAFLTGWTGGIDLTKKFVDCIEEVTEDNYQSLSSTVFRGALGGIALGPVGMFAGLLTGKKKKIHVVAVIFKDGKRSLLEIDDAIYKVLIKSTF